MHSDCVCMRRSAPHCVCVLALCDTIKLSASPLLSAFRSSKVKAALVSRSPQLTPMGSDDQWMMLEVFSSVFFFSSFLLFS